MDNKYVDIFPNKVPFSRTSTQLFYEGKVTLTNKTDKCVLFKVYINKSKLYTASPSTNFIAPGEQTTINFKRNEKVNFEI